MTWKNSQGGYSQYGEDLILKEILSENGYFLEIGSFCPFIFSNTRFLVDRGWGGCYVDGCSFAIGRFIQEYKDNDKIKIVQALIGDADRFIKFYNSITDAISSTDINHADKWKKSGSQFREVYTVMISMNTLQTILPPVIDFINIDVEGQSAYLSTLINYDQLQTKVVCIEHDNSIDMINSYMSKFNFTVHYTNATNIIYKR
jgi:hypothetical protein